MTREKMPKLIPVQSISTGPPIEPFLPDTTGRSVELPETSVVRGSPVVLVVALQFPVEGFLLLLHRIMPMLLAPGRYLHKTAPETLSHRSHVNREFPLPASFTDMREPKKIESCRLLPTRLF
jgi:hypothetical protein